MVLGTKVLVVEGMTCSHCVASVTNALEAIQGVKSAKVDLAKGSAVVTGDEGNLPSDSNLIESVEMIGFEGRMAQPSRTQPTGPVLISTSNNSVFWSDPKRTEKRAATKKASTLGEKTPLLVTEPRRASIELFVAGMTCEKCELWVESAILTSFPEATAKADSRSGRVVVKGLKIDDKKSAHKSITAAVIGVVQATGYPAVEWESRESLANRSRTSSERPSALTMSLGIEGMTCSSCVNRVETALKGLGDGVVSANVHLLTKQAKVTISPDVLAPDQLVQAVNAQGYQASIMGQRSQGTAQLRVKRMVCSSCPGRIERALRQMADLSLHSISVNGVTNTAFLVFDTSATKIPLEGLVARVQDRLLSLDYDSELISVAASSSQRKQDSEAADWKRLFFLGFVLTVAIMGLDGFIEDQLLLFSVQGVLATVCQFTLGAKFGQNAWVTFRNGSANMSTLVTLSSGTGYVYSAAVLLLMLFGELAVDNGSVEPMFDTPVMLLTFIVTGKWLEAMAKERTMSAISDLRKLQPKTATRVDRLGEGLYQQDRTVNIEDIEVGMFLRIHPGEAVPTDGKVVFGSSELDESMVTGESRLIPKYVDGSLLGGTVNTSGTLVSEVTAAATNSFLSSIIQLIEEAQSSKAPIQAKADLVASYFTPGALLLALATSATWASLYLAGRLPEDYFGSEHPLVAALTFGISVLVVACPCALGLATPTAVMVASGVAARYGVLFRGGKALEALGTVDAFIFDKTGTLTDNRPNVASAIFGAAPRREVLAMVLEAQRSSEHPVGAALRAYAESQVATEVGFEMESFEALVGRGVRVEMRRNGGGRFTLLIGTQRLLGESGVPDGAVEALPGHGAFLRAAIADSHTVVYVSRGQDVLAAFSVASQVREDAILMVEEMQARGVEVRMLTGDNRDAARGVAERVGIPSHLVCAEARPEDKLNYIRTLQTKGLVVAMVGDGVNDAPALAQADIGVAVGSGTDVAISTAEVILIRPVSYLLGVVTAHDISKATIRRVYTNLFLSLVYNVIAIPTASGALYPLLGISLPPWGSGIAMALSSVSVVTSSLTLAWFSEKVHHKAPPRHDYEKLAQNV